MSCRCQFVDAFTEYLNAYSRDASGRKNEGDDDSGGEDDDGDFGGVRSIEFARRSDGHRFSNSSRRTLA